MKRETVMMPGGILHAILAVVPRQPCALDVLTASLSLMQLLYKVLLCQGASRLLGRLPYCCPLASVSCCTPHRLWLAAYVAV